VRSVQLAYLWGVLGALLALLVGVVGGGPIASSTVAAQGRRDVLTVVGGDGALLALDGARWVTVWPDVGHGATVTGLAWHPSRPEILVIRRETKPGQPGEPFDSLVRLDLATGIEETLLAGIGPQARIIGPRFAPDERSAFARVECCLAREYVQIGVPPADTSFVRGDARAFLDPAIAEETDVSVGPFAPDGRVLVSVFCCMGEEPANNPGGLYLVDPDFTHGQRVAQAVSGSPIGLDQGGAWAAMLDTSEADDGSPPLVAVDLPSGRKRTLLRPTDPPLAPLGDVAADGRIVVAQQGDEAGPRDALGSLWLVPTTGQPSALPAPPRGLTAFAWADPDLVAKARTSAAAGSASRVQVLSRAGDCLFDMSGENRCLAP